MELLIKLYKDKPSRIGIKYTYSFQALRPYEDLIRKYPNDSFTLKLEPKNNKIILTLQSELSGEKTIYKDLDYKPDQLKKLEQQGHSDIPLQFVHVYSEANVILIAKPFKKPLFISISSFEIIGIHNFS